MKKRLKVKILLTGGLGFVGKRFIKKYSETYDLIIFAKKEHIEENKNEEFLKNVILEEGKIEGEELYNVIINHKPDVVIHLAALTHLKRCQDNPTSAFLINVFGTYNALNACIETKSKFIFISSREVYGNSIKNISTEGDPLIPNNVYGITKMLGEKLVQLCHERNQLEFSILRLTNLFGPEGDGYGAQIMIKDVINKNKITILGGSQKLNYIYVDDVVDVIEQTVSKVKCNNEIYNIGSENTFTVKEFAQKIFEVFGKNAQIDWHPMRDTETVYFNPDLQKSISAYGNYLKTPLEDGIRNTINWYQKYP